VRLPFAAPLLAALTFAWPTPLPTSPPLPPGTILWNGARATSFDLDVRPLDVTADGDARALVRVVLRDTQGAPTHARRGTSFGWFTSRGEAQWQTGLRFGGHAAIVSVREEGPVTLRVVANRPTLGERRVTFDPRQWHLSRVAGAALGPHLVRIGWFPRVTNGAVEIARIGSDGRARIVAHVAAPSSSWSDDDVTPGETARYVVTLPGGAAMPVGVPVPDEIPPSGLDVVRGKGMWLAFSGDPLDDDGFDKLDVDRIVATAQRAGIRYVELRLAYGAFGQVTPAAKPTIDRLIDTLDAAGIAVVGWTVPRAVAFDDLAEAVAVARYRTPSGHGVRGLAVDLERGEEFLGEGAPGYAALRDYLGLLRRAVGPHVLLVATVEDPFLERLDEARFPYAEIAAQADVLQPMTYWRATGADAVEATSESIARLRALARRPIPIALGAQTAYLSRHGPPPPGEIRASIAAAKRLDAVGVAFYDWRGTSPPQWQALADTPW
jgi:hypothetical protein